MDAQVELLPLHDEALIKRRQKKIPVTSEPVESYGQKTVIPPGVARHDGRVAVGSRLVRKDAIKVLTVTA